MNSNYKGWCQFFMTPAFVFHPVRMGSLLRSVQRLNRMDQPKSIRHCSGQMLFLISIY